MLRPFCLTFSLMGTLTADQTWDFILPFPAQLIHVSAMADTNACAIKVGTSSDDEAYVEAADGGAITAGAVTEVDRTGFVDDQFPHIAEGAQVRVTFDHTGSNPTDFIAILTFTEG